MATDQALDFFISYTKVDQHWAEWIAVELDQAHYRTYVQAFDIRAGNNFPQEMHVALSAARHTIAVVSAAYLDESKFGRLEWTAAMRNDPAGIGRRLMPVWVEDVEPGGLLGAVVAINLVGLNEDDARRQLLRGVGPDQPHPAFAPFPGQAASPEDVARFPGVGNSTAPRDAVAVLLCGFPTLADPFRQRLHAAVRSRVPHVELLDGVLPGSDEAADAEMHRADAVVVVVQHGDGAADLAAARRQLAAARRRRVPILVARTDSGTRIPEEIDRLSSVDVDDEVGWEFLLRRLGRLGEVRHEPDPLPSAAPERDGPTTGPRMVNSMPAGASATFVDRGDFLVTLVERLAERSTPIVMLTGPNGIGKTALLRRLCQEPEHADPGLSLHGVVYESGRGHRWITATTLLTDIAKAVEEPRDERRPWRSRLDPVLGLVGRRPVLVVVDEADELFDLHGECVDRELGELLLTLADRAGEHAISVVMCLRRSPLSFMAELSDQGTELRLDRGVPRDWADSLLSALDPGDDGLAGATEPQLDRLWTATSGNPRALELATCLLSMAGLSIDQLADHLDDTPDALRTLLGLVFVQLGLRQLRVVQALSVFGRPVPPEAVDQLLQDAMPGISSRPVLSALARRNLIRRREGHYYLPPVPDAEYVLSSLPDTDNPSALDRRTLWLRAAAYFRKKRAGRMSTVDDLWAHFGEVELLLHIGSTRDDPAALRTALELMDDIDDAHLRRWGQSEILAPWRRRLIDKLDDAELEGRNLSYLVAAMQQQDGHEDDIAWLERALGCAEEAGNVLATYFLYDQLATAEFQAGLIARSAATRRQVIAGHRELRSPEDEAKACSGLALSLARQGAFDEASAQLDRAWELIADYSVAHTRATRALLLQNMGWLAGQLGRDEEAIAAIDRGLAVVGDEHVRARGALHSARAAVLLYAQDPISAAKEAATALEIGLIRDDYALCREANVTRTLAGMVLGRGDAGQAAAAAAHYSRTPGAFDALSILGVAAFRSGDTAGALRAFERALKKAELRYGRDRRDYQLLNVRGVVLSGLALLGKRGVHEAIQSFEAARELTGGAAGVLRRNRLRLSLFGPDADDTILSAALTACWPMET